MSLSDHDLFLLLWLFLFLYVYLEVWTRAHCYRTRDKWASFPAFVAGHSVHGTFKLTPVTMCRRNSYDPLAETPARSPPGGLDALSNEERVQLAAAVAERFQAEAQIIGAVESSRAQRNAVLGRGRYAPITRTDLTFANGSLYAPQIK